MMNSNSAFNNACVEVISELHPELDKDLILKQVELEETMRAEGMMREERLTQQAREKGLESKTSYGMVLLRERTNAIAREVEKLLADVQAGKPGTARWVYGKLSESILSQSLIQEAWIKDVSCPSEVR